MHGYKCVSITTVMYNTVKILSQPTAGGRAAGESCKCIDRQWLDD